VSVLGNIYSIENNGSKLARVFFAQGNEVMKEIVVATKGKN
jgi:hypothetical protein